MGLLRNVIFTSKILIILDTKCQTESHDIMVVQIRLRLRLSLRGILAISLLRRVCNFNFLETLKF